MLGWKSNKWSVVRVFPAENCGRCRKELRVLTPRFDGDTFWTRVETRAETRARNKLKLGEDFKVFFGICVYCHKKCFLTLFRKK
jgi:hypothetical protein